VTDNAARTAVAIAYLANDEPARRLVLAWPLLPKELKGRALLREWSRLAGVSLSIAERTTYVLTQHQLVRSDGTVDPEAMKVVTHLAATALRSQGARR
jgi:hypothetical protein